MLCLFGTVMNINETNPGSHTHTTKMYPPLAVYVLSRTQKRGETKDDADTYPHMSNTLDQIPVDKTWSPTESSGKMKPEVQ